MSRALASRDPLAYLDGLNGQTIRLGLTPLRRLLGRMNHPERKYPCVIIGGTNGKGSIAAMTAAMLSAGGNRTGLYTSPHLLDVRERIRVDGFMITTEQMRKSADRIIGSLYEEITYFEFLTAMAFDYFDRQGVDVAVLEVGMGGRLDATNVVRPAVSVISNVSMDHGRYLGNTLERIAWEKSGIIKKNSCCLTAASQSTVVHVIKEICRKKQARFFRLGDDIRVRKHPEKGFTFMGLGRRYNRLHCSLKGRHQINNAALAVAAALLLETHGHVLHEAAIREGLSNTIWEGRLEIVRRRPSVLIDGAHNAAGISSLCSALKEEFHYHRLTVIFGVLDDKDAASMLRRLSPLADSLVLTRPENDRSYSPLELLPVAERYHSRVRAIERPEEAIRRVLDEAAPDDLICITGSLYLVAAAKRFFGRRCSS